MAYNLDDYQHLYKNSGRKTKRYRLSCDQCGSDRGYGMKSRSSLLCKVCTHKGSDYLKGKRDTAYKKRMSIAKQGCNVWNTGKVGVYSNETLEKMRDAHAKRNPNGELINAEQYRIKRRCLVYLARQIKRWVSVQTTSRYCNNLFDFSFCDFKSHLENQFQEGMSWENHGEWHIDHIIPDSWFSYSSVSSEEFKKSWALENLQPLWAKDNLKKSNKYKG